MTTSRIVRVVIAAVVLVFAILVTVMSFRGSSLSGVDVGPATLITCIAVAVVGYGLFTIATVRAQLAIRRLRRVTLGELIGVTVTRETMSLVAPESRSNLERFCVAEVGGRSIRFWSMSSPPRVLGELDALSIRSVEISDTPLESAIEIGLRRAARPNSIVIVPNYSKFGLSLRMPRRELSRVRDRFRALAAPSAHS